MESIVRKSVTLSLFLLLILFVACKKDDYSVETKIDLPAQEKPEDKPADKPITVDYPLPKTILTHKLTLTGKSTKIAVDATSYLSRACRDNLGSANFKITWTNDSKSFFDLQGKSYIFNAVAERYLKDLNLPLSRIYSTYYEAGGLHNGLDMLAEVCNRNNMPQEKMIVCIEHFKATEILSPEVYKDAVSYAKSKGYRFKYWEISNEPEYAWGSGLENPLTYAKHVVECYDAIKSVDPTAYAGCQILRKSYYTNQVLDNIKGKADFISGHWYGITNTDEFTTTDVILTENYKNLEFIASENANIAKRTGKVIPQIDTEWRLLADGTINGIKYDGETNDKCGNIVGTLFQAVRMIYTIRDNYTLGACSWHTMGAQPGILVPSGYNRKGQEITGNTTYLYWLYYYFIRQTGDVVLDFTGSAPSYTGKAWGNVDAGGEGISNTGPLTPLMVTKSTDGSKLFITIVNASTTESVPFSAEIKNFAFTSQSAVRISDMDVTQSYLQKDNSRFLSTANVTVDAGTVSCTLPPMSCTFITLVK